MMTATAKNKVKNGIFKYPDGSFVSYRMIAGQAPGVFYMHGTQSSIESTKAQFVQKYCQEKGIAFTSFNFRGHGDSSCEYKDSTVSMWLNDALSIMDNITSGDLLVMGSSMGGWIMLLLAMRRPNRVKGMIGLAAAPDFTTAVWDALPPAMTQKLMQDGYIETPNDGEYSEIWSLALLQDGNNNLVLNHPITTNAEVILIQGDDDKCVPRDIAFKIKQQISSGKVEVKVLGGAGHNLSRSEDFEVIKNAIDKVRNSI